MISLRSKRVMITGASSGLGKEMSFAFGKEGSELILNARRREKLEEVKEFVEKFGGKAYIIAGDVTKEKIMDKLAQEAEKGIDILVNNAGIIYMEEFHEVTDEQIDEIFNIDAISPIKLTRRIYPIMIRQGYGHIVNIVTTAGYEGKKNHVIYGAAKFALSGFSRALTREALEKGIKITAVYPGGMNTNLFDKYKVDKSKLMDPAEVARMIVELCKADPDVVPNEFVVRRASSGKTFKR